MSKDLAQIRYEAHRKYIDLQYIVRGAEIIKFHTLDQMVVNIPYDAEKDVEFYEYRAGMDFALRQGMVAIFYPQDVHAPGLKLDIPQIVAKSVVKVKLDACVKNSKKDRNK